MSDAGFTIPRASNKTLRRQLLDENGDAIDLTGYTSLKLYVATGLETASAALTLNKNMSIYLSAPSGTVEYAFVPADTSTLSDVDYIYEIEVVIPGGTFVTYPEKFKIAARVKA